MHQGPLVMDSSQTLAGRAGAVVRGGIRVRASDVTIRNVSVVGGEHGIDIEEARNVVLDRVSVQGFQLDGIHGARGIGIYCGDRSMCEFEQNVVSKIRPMARAWKRRA